MMIMINYYKRFKIFIKDFLWKLLLRQNLILCDIGNTSTKFFIDKNIKNYYKNDKIPKFKDDIFYIINKKSWHKIILIY